MADVWPVQVCHTGHAFFSTAQLIYGQTAITTALLKTAQVPNCERCHSFPQTPLPQDTPIPSVLPGKSLVAVNRPCERGLYAGLKLGGAACVHVTTTFRIL